MILKTKSEVPRCIQWDRGNTFNAFRSVCVRHQLPKLKHGF